MRSKENQRLMTWSVLMVAEVLTFAKTQPTEKDASHLTMKLYRKLKRNNPPPSPAEGK